MPGLPSPGFLLMESKGHDRLAFMTLLLQFIDQLWLEIAGIRDHLAGRDLFRRRAVETELAYAQPFLSAIFDADWRTKLAARHRTMGVKIAHACRGIERRTRLVVGPFVEGELGAFAFGENSGFSVSGKRGR